MSLTVVLATRKTEHVPHAQAHEQATAVNMQRENSFVTAMHSEASHNYSLRVLLLQKGGWQLFIYLFFFFLKTSVFHIARFPSPTFTINKIQWGSKRNSSAATCVRFSLFHSPSERWRHAKGSSRTSAG